jgi:hypothetical protein
MAAGATYNSIATFTATGSSNTIIFSSIPQTYTDLVIIADGTLQSSHAFFNVQFNTDTSSGSTNYSSTRFIGFGNGAAYSDRYINYFCLQPGLGGTQRGMMRVEIQSYRNTAMFKTVLWRDGNPGGGSLCVGLWRDTTAISTITFTGGNNLTIPSGTNVTLYGIEAA